MKIQASEIRTGDFLWNPNSANESIKVTKVEQVGEYVVVSGDASGYDTLRIHRRQRFLTATDAVSVTR